MKTMKNLSQDGQSAGRDLNLSQDGQSPGRDLNLGQDGQSAGRDLNLSQDGQSPGRDLNLGPPEHETRVLTIQPWRLVLHIVVKLALFQEILRNNYYRQTSQILHIHNSA
jgi:hypothetical protein